MELQALQVAFDLAVPQAVGSSERQVQASERVLAQEQLLRESLRPACSQASR